MVLDVNLPTLVDGKGGAASLPDLLGGISGGLIIHLPIDLGAPSLTAVQHSVFRSPDKLLVRGTLWQYVFGLLEAELKGTGAATRLLLPKGLT
jgi:hypothetical protein